MGFIDKYPYTDFHELNLDWLLQRVRELASQMEGWQSANTIHYAGTWDITKAYQAWNIVVDGNEGYISKKPVPAGIALTNTEYWELIADYTAIVADLGQRVEDLESAMTTEDASINRLKKYYRAESWSNRRVICISDSYGLVPDTDHSWIPNLKWYLNIPDSQFWRNQYNGSGFHGTQPDHTFQKLFEEVITGWSSEQKDLITDIVIVGGYNDANSLHYGATTTDIKTDAALCLATMRNTCKNATIWISMPAWDNNATSWHESLRVVEHLYMQAINYAKRIAYIDNNYWLHRSALTTSDGLHPTSTGSSAIAETIASVMNGGSAFCDGARNEVNGLISPTFDSYGSDVSNVVVTGGSMSIDGHTAAFRWQRINFDLDADVLPQYAAEIGTFDDTVMTGGDGLKDAYSVPVRVINNNHYADCLLMIYNKKLILLNLDGNNLDTGTIQIGPGTMTGSIML